MSEQQVPDTRSRDGSAADRKMTKRDGAAYGSLLGLLTGTMDWLLLNCFAGGHWHYVPPSQQLIEVACFIILFPAALWLGDIISLIGDIIKNRLKKEAST